MDVNIHALLIIIQRTISCIGILVILSGILIAIAQYISYVFTGQISHNNNRINQIRLNLGRILILGLEFIVAADLIGSTTTPDYYTVGILAIIVAIRTLLSFSLSKEIAQLSKKD